MNTATASRIAVIAAIDAFCEMANNHPSTPRHDWGTTVFFADKPGKNVTRIIMANQRLDGSLTNRSVHAFVDNTTGDLLKAATWKAPAKGVRGNIVTDFDNVAKRFQWAGGYLYKENLK